MVNRPEAVRDGGDLEAAVWHNDDLEAAAPLVPQRRWLISDLGSRWLPVSGLGRSREILRNRSREARWPGRRRRDGAVAVKGRRAAAGEGGHRVGRLFLARGQETSVVRAGGWFVIFFAG